MHVSSMKGTELASEHMNRIAQFCRVPVESRLFRHLRGDVESDCKSVQCVLLVQNLLCCTVILNTAMDDDAVNQAILNASGPVLFSSSASVFQATLTFGGEVLRSFRLGQVPELQGGMLERKGPEKKGPISSRTETRLKRDIECRFPVDLSEELRRGFGAISRADRVRLYNVFCQPKQIDIEDTNPAEFSIWVVEKLRKYLLSAKSDQSSFVEFVDSTQPDADAAALELAGVGVGDRPEQSDTNFGGAGGLSASAQIGAEGCSNLKGESSQTFSPGSPDLNSRRERDEIHSGNRREKKRAVNLNIALATAGGAHAAVVGPAGVRGDDRPNQSDDIFGAAGSMSASTQKGAEGYADIHNESNQIDHSCSPGWDLRRERGDIHSGSNRDKKRVARLHNAYETPVAASRSLHLAFDSAAMPPAELTEGRQKSDIATVHARIESGEQMSQKDDDSNDIPNNDDDFNDIPKISKLEHLISADINPQRNSQGSDRISFVDVLGHRFADVVADALASANMILADVPEDGNCQFSAIIRQVRLESNLVGFHGLTVTSLRQQAADWLENNRCLSAHIQTSDAATWETYVQSVRTGHRGDRSSVQWGDHITLFACANVLRVNLEVWNAIPYVSDIDTFFFVIVSPLNGESSADLRLMHVRDLHYMSIEPSPGDEISQKRAPLSV
jgi:hypothetical protein